MIFAMIIYNLQFQSRRYSWPSAKYASLIFFDHLCRFPTPPIFPKAAPGCSIRSCTSFWALQWKRVATLPALSWKLSASNPLPAQCGIAKQESNGINPSWFGRAPHGSPSSRKESDCICLPTWGFHVDPICAVQWCGQASAYWKATRPLST